LRLCYRNSLLGGGQLWQILIVGIDYFESRRDARVEQSNLLFVGSTALTEELNTAATIIRRHVAEAWSIALAERVIHAASARNLLVVVCALFLDGTLSSVESWALYRRYRWGRWLVVCATSILLPLEFVALIRHLSAVRLAVLLVNSLIVIYLIPCRVTVEGRRAKDSNRNCTDA
jgi:uncharacterized membrane protein (DUF2068 family)